MHVHVNNPKLSNKQNDTGANDVTLEEKVHVNTSLYEPSVSSGQAYLSVSVTWNDYGPSQGYHQH